MSSKRDSKPLIPKDSYIPDSWAGTALLVAIVALVAAIAAVVVGGVSLDNFNNRDIIKIVNGVESTLGISFGLEASDVTVVVTGCTNQTISGTNEEFSDGSFLFARNCDVIEDNTCQENVCLSDGTCARRTVSGGECSSDAQCVDSIGPGYVCNLTLCACEVMVPVNGSMYTNSLVCDNNGTMSVVMVMDAQCPMPGQVLTAIDSSSADWQDPVTEIPCATGDVVVSNATCPTTGQVLTATSSGVATWQDPSITTLTQSGTISFTGVWASPQVADYSITKVGTIVSMQLSAIGPATANAGGVIASPLNFLPAAYRPTNTIYIPAVIVDNAVFRIGQIAIFSSGSIAVYSNLPAVAFSGTGATGTSTTSAYTWSTV